MSENMFRVVRSSGEVETGWQCNHEWTDSEGVRRVVLTREVFPLEGPNFTIIKRPTKALFDHWQAGGMATSSEELET